MLLLRRTPRQPQQYVCRQCIRRRHSAAPVGFRPPSKAGQQPSDPAEHDAQWKEQADRIRAGIQHSLLGTLEERGLVKDVAGGTENLDWLLTNKRIGAYVGVDPTAPSLHVGHLLPLMVLYWLYLHGYYTVSLVGGGTVQIGDPSGRTTARSWQSGHTHHINTVSIRGQLTKLWSNVKALGIKHQFSQRFTKKSEVLDNQSWYKGLDAIELMRDVGSCMRLGPMLSRDSVKMRMQSGGGMSFSEFSYPIFQAYDWWTMYSKKGVQLQIGGSDQYGNICAGMDTIHHMRKLHAGDENLDDDDLGESTSGLTTPLLTTASGEKFGKSAGNAVWLDQEMLSSFDLYQYFVKTPDADVERYLKLLTFLPLEHIALLMREQTRDASRRLAQHTLAKEIVELAHGAAAAKKAQTAHKEAFSQGTGTYPLGALRRAVDEFKAREAAKAAQVAESSDSTVSSLSSYTGSDLQTQILTHKKAVASTTGATTTVPSPSLPSSSASTPMTTLTPPIYTLPLSALIPGSFPTLLHALGLATTKSAAQRLIATRGAYVLVPNSGTVEYPTGLRWAVVENGVGKDFEGDKRGERWDPRDFLVDFEVLGLRAGKSKVVFGLVRRDEDILGAREAGEDGSEEVEVENEGVEKRQFGKLWRNSKRDKQ